MKTNLYLFKIITLVLLLIFSLTACVGDAYENDVVVSSSNESISSELPTSSDETSSENISSEETQSSSSSKADTGSVINDGFKVIPKVTESSKYGDLISQIPSGKKVTVLGDLADEKYKDAASRLETVLKGYSREISLVAYSLDNTKAVSFN
ncbi:MAG: hypothetical protein J6V50_02680, partial [Clostridia bacterium]|nr:hypothetical protein [Clostridia bacterium]